MGAFYTIAILVLGYILYKFLFSAAAPRIDPRAFDFSGATKAACNDGEEVDMSCPLILGSGNHPFEIVGESNYQTHIRRFAGENKRGTPYVRKIARLEPEPSNPYDKNAVAVRIEGATVGYLDRESASKYREMAGCKTVQCSAEIRGGRSTDMLGIWLDFDIDDLEGAF